ncbi:MAG: hypothetical protein C4519_17500 [Desulfobacteraceae bacterium]|nr:MAG: hypothetical protein C4519_17500 [Desulfobacteraceae bacterium]
MKEHALKFGPDGSLIGILSEAAAPPGGRNMHQGTAALLFNAGLIHHIGPNRIYVKMARRLACMGITVLRFDFSGIGDSGPRMDKLPAEASMLDEARQAMDLLEQRCAVHTFICIGLCAGAAAAARISVADARVKKAILINPLLPKTPQTELMYHLRYYHSHALFNPRSWLKFIFLKSNYRTLWKALCLKIRTQFHSPSLCEGELPGITAELKNFFHHLDSRGVRLFLVFSEDDIGEQYIQNVIGHEYNALKQSGLMHTETLVGADHLVTLLPSQNHLLESVTAWLGDAV